MKRAIKRFYPTLIITVLVVVGVIVLIPILKSSSLGDLFDFDFFKNRTTIDHGAVILEAIKKQAKLETIAMLERTDNTVEKKDGWCVDRVRYFGLFTVTAGIDLQEITASDIVVTENADQSQTVTIKLPHAIILHAEPDIANDKTVKEVEVQAPWLCRYGSQMAKAVLEAQNAAREDAKNAALKAGILEMAEKHAGVVLQELLKNAKYPNVVIKYSPGGDLPENLD
jgi:hypothetical protein